MCGGVRTPSTNCIICILYAQAGWHIPLFPLTTDDVRGILLYNTSVNRPLGATLCTFPLHRVEYILCLGNELIELGSSASEDDAHRLTLHVLQDDHTMLLSLPDDMHMIIA